MRSFGIWIYTLLKSAVGGMHFESAIGPEDDR